MPSFQRLTIEQFAAALFNPLFTRPITTVHMHHTWRPNHAQWRGHDTILGMWRVHTQQNKWSDIAQHVTIDPDGGIWTGRNWNSPPASAKGHNGSRDGGPFMLEIIGDFDRGRDEFGGEQRSTALKVIALVQKRFELAPERLMFHREMAPKSCPGTAVDFGNVVAEVRALHASLDPIFKDAASGATRGAFSREAVAGERELMRSIAGPVVGNDGDAECRGDEMDEDALALLLGDQGSRGLGREEALPAAVLDELKPHVVNLRLGRFSDEGEFTTTETDADAIFDQHLPHWLDNNGDKPLRIVLFAHGGLVKESLGLRIAYRQMRWWLDNGIYPIHFVWETGLTETLGQLLERATGRPRGTRGLADYTSDPLIEAIARSLYGPRIWGGMKRSAELASAPAGGARHVVRRLAEFVRDKGDRVELHAVGHSAGSIFHAHLLAMAAGDHRLRFKTLHFLAPAVHADLFWAHVQPLIRTADEENFIDHLAIFTMRDAFERDDNCAGLYRKSLLYLVSKALEGEGEAPILGLERTLRGDRDLKELLGLAGTPNPYAEVIWSRTDTESGRSASHSTSHGGFDDDGPTMNSVLRRVLGLRDQDPIAKEFPSRATRGEREALNWLDQVDWPPCLEQIPPYPVAAPLSTPTAPSTTPQSFHAAKQPSRLPLGRKRALCIGIDAYRSAPLYGCIADANEWRDTLASLGFDVTQLIDAQATRQGILAGLERLLADSRAGDILVFQYAGHGTQLPDANGDEQGDGIDAPDEALVPFDYNSGAYVIDDDIGAALDRAPAGVAITLFIDCCHSGTISRFGVGPGALPNVGDDGLRPRFLPATQAMANAHLAFRRSSGQRHALAPLGTRSLDTMREVLFAACLSHEVAYESGGHGEFTLRATRLLRSSSNDFTNESFESRVVAAFGQGARQHPRLYCSVGMKGSRLLGTP